MCLLLSYQYPSLCISLLLLLFVWLYLSAAAVVCLFVAVYGGSILFCLLFVGFVYCYGCAYIKE